MAIPTQNSYGCQQRYAQPCSHMELYGKQATGTRLDVTSKNPTGRSLLHLQVQWLLQKTLKSAKDPNQT